METKAILKCLVCAEEEYWSENLIFCTGSNCNVVVHQGCCVITENLDSWLCEKCENNHILESKVKCELCPNVDGLAIKRTDSEGYAHILCALYVPEANFGCRESFEPIILKEIPKFRFDCKGCYICLYNKKEVEAKQGCRISCAVEDCKRYFHVTCAHAHDLLIQGKEPDGDEPRSPDKYKGYCMKHHPSNQENNYNENIIYDLSSDSEEEKAKNSEDDEFGADITESSVGSRSTSPASSVVVDSGLPSSFSESAISLGSDRKRQPSSSSIDSFNADHNSPFKKKIAFESGVFPDTFIDKSSYREKPPSSEESESITCGPSDAEMDSWSDMGSINPKQSNSRQNVISPSSSSCDARSSSSNNCGSSIEEESSSGTIASKSLYCLKSSTTNSLGSRSSANSKLKQSEAAEKDSFHNIGNDREPELVQNVKRLSRDELEHLVVNQMAIVITSNEKISKLEQKVENSQKHLDSSRVTIARLRQQMKDLECVVKKFVLQRATGKFVPPTKVTRHVGIQVNDGKGVALVKVEKSDLQNNITAKTSATSASSVNNTLPDQKVAQTSQGTFKLPQTTSNTARKTIRVVKKTENVEPSPSTSGLQCSNGGFVAAGKPINSTTFATPSNDNSDDEIEITDIISAPKKTKIERIPFELPPLPVSPPWPIDPSMKLLLSKPVLKVFKRERGACLSWTLNNITDAHAAIADWKIYMCRQTDWLEPSVTWERVGDVIRHTPSSMSHCIVTLDPSVKPSRHYYFVIQATDIYGRCSPFCDPQYICFP